jgi:retron-type reverse transcriptase
MAGGWIIEIDIRKYFDSIDHERLREVLHSRIRDGVILRWVRLLSGGEMHSEVGHLSLRRWGFRGGRGSGTRAPS